MANLLDLASRLRSTTKTIDEAGNLRKKKAALAMVKYLVNETPVDTSQALSNWQVGLGRPVMAEIGPHVPGTAGSSAGASRAAAIAAAEATLAQAKPGQPVYLSNLLPYIRALNNGSSKQHPGGFVEASIIIGRKANLDTKLIRLRK